jgi:hypothetical protein
MNNLTPLKGDREIVKTSTPFLQIKPRAAFPSLENRQQRAED